jgi:hypothetical protein
MCLKRRKKSREREILDEYHAHDSDYFSDQSQQRKTSINKGKYMSKKDDYHID